MSLLAVCGVVAAVVAGAGPAGAVRGAVVAGPAAGGSLSAAGAAQASALAASSGVPVQVASEETDWSQTFAEPGGGFEAVESLVPQRVREPGGSWAAVDTTLSVRPGGVVAPAAITTGLSLSDGGRGPLYTLSQGGRSLSASSPFGALPVPSLSGATATYAGVLPGVNLLVTATATGVSELVEVMNAAAAANPGLARITFPVAGAGLSVAAGGDGALTAVDSAGRPVFAAAPSLMWDTAGAAAGGPGWRRAAGGRQRRRRARPRGGAGPVPGDHWAVMRVAAGPGSVSLIPAASVLAGRPVFPVFD